MDNHGSLVDLAAKILEKEQSISIENMLACKILSPWKHLRFDLLTQEWHPLNEDHNSVYSHPFYISQDGSLLVLRDKSIKEKDLTEEEKKQIGILQSKHRVQQSGGFGSYKPHVEKSMKIVVKKKEDYAKEEAAKSEVSEQLELKTSTSTEDTKSKIEEPVQDEEFAPFF